MTFLEKAMEMNIKMTESEIVDCYCPKDLELERVEDEPVCYCGTVAEECRECWNREMPNTEADGIKSVKDKRTSITVELEKSVVEIEEQGYNKGLNDAWELAKKCVHIEGRGEDNELMFKVFGTVFLKDVFDNNSYLEALAKLKAYEEAQEQRKIKVGNVVEMCHEDEEEKTFKGVVLEIGTNGLVTIFDENTNVRVWEIEKLKKTGKHIDIQSILEQIGE